mmetsp:Transcript_25873/g.72182  ORF Transcript_25873/g.72182 Transcript_25873/m.72182 type:complete len:201 (-) Transcript_25873:762-1364(-)
MFQNVVDGVNGRNQTSSLAERIPHIDRTCGVHQGALQLVWAEMSHGRFPVLLQLLEHGRQNARRRAACVRRSHAGACLLSLALKRVPRYRCHGAAGCANVRQRAVGRRTTRGEDERRGLHRNIFGSCLIVVQWQHGVLLLHHRWRDVGADGDGRRDGARRSRGGQGRSVVAGGCEHRQPPLVHRIRKDLRDATVSVAGLP